MLPQFRNSAEPAVRSEAADRRLILNLEEKGSFSPGTAKPLLRFDAPKTQTVLAGAPRSQVLRSFNNP